MEGFEKDLGGHAWLCKGGNDRKEARGKGVEEERFKP